MPLLLLWLVVRSGFAFHAASPSGRQRWAEEVASCWALLHETARETGEPPACVAGAAVSMAPRILGRHAQGMSPGDRGRFERALGAAFLRGLREQASGHGLDAEVPEMTVSHSEDSNRSVVSLRLGSTSGPHLLRVSMAANQPSTGDTFRVMDVSLDGDSVVETYRALCEDWIERYSVAYAIGELEGRGVVVLADFEDDVAGALPHGWRSRGWTDVIEEPYEIVAEEGNQFLRAEDRGENVVLYRDIRWNSLEYPYLSWRWRVRSLPDGGDARVEEKADNAAAIYLSYRRKLGLLPVTVKFVWSERLATGSAFRRPGIGMPWTVVAGRGAPDRARWHRVVVHTADVYRSTFGGKAGDRPLGIGLLSDANNTGGLAAADYDDIVALKQASDVMQVSERIELARTTLGEPEALTSSSWP